MFLNVENFVISFEKYSFYLYNFIFTFGGKRRKVNVPREVQIPSDIYEILFYFEKKSN